MSKLGCNIVIYRPDPAMLAESFHPRHVEVLLDEAAVLIDRCLHDFKEYCALDYAWHHFITELRAEEKQVDLDRQRRRWEVPEEEEEPREEEAAAEPAATEEAAEATAAVAVTEEEGGEEEGEKEETPAPEPEKVEEPAITTRLELRAGVVQRKKDLASRGQPFALNEQRDLVLRRLCRDYEEALNRACVAEEGLKRYYGYADLASPIPSEAEPLSESITSLALWIRNSREWLVRYQRQEQPFTRVVSVRSLLSRGLWTQVKHARESFSLKVQVPPELFKGHENCRVRGVAASLVGELGAVQWSVVIRLPQEALYERGGESVEVDQSDLPPCILGRVENRRSPRPIEMCGATTHINASPLGKPTPGGVWLVDILRPAGSTSETFGHLEDLVLEISAVGKPKEMRKTREQEAEKPTETRVEFGAP